MQLDSNATETAEEKEDEPRLKYQRLGSSVPEVLEKTSASCLCVSEKILALGTHGGSVHVLDVSGNEVSGNTYENAAFEGSYTLKTGLMQVKSFPAHKAVVNDISFDEEAEFIASSSDDGSVAVSELKAASPAAHVLRL